MKSTIKGVERIDYYSKKNERQVTGVTFHVERKDANVVGTAVEAIYLADATLDNLGVIIPDDKYKETIGKVLDIEYNRRGFPQSIVIN